MRLQVKHGRVSLNGDYRKYGFKLKVARQLKECMMPEAIVDILVSSINEELSSANKILLTQEEINFISELIKS